MLRQKLSLITLLITVLIIILGWITYDYYLVPFYQNNVSQTKKIDLNKEQKLILTPQIGQKNISGIEFEMIGESSKNVSMLIYNPARQNIQSVSIKKGTIEHVQFMNWSSDTCIVDLLPSSISDGSLTINYRFIGSK